MAQSTEELQAQLRVDISVKQGEMDYLNNILGALEGDTAAEEPKVAEEKPKKTRTRKSKPKPEEVEVVTPEVETEEPEVYEAEADQEKKTTMQVKKLIAEWLEVEGNTKEDLPGVFKEATGLAGLKKHVNDENATVVFYKFQAHSSWGDDFC